MMDNRKDRAMQITHQQDEATHQEKKTTLIDLLKLIHREQFPLTAYKFGLDSQPQSVFTVTIAFQSNQETWLTVNIANEILVPWYDCEVDAIEGSERECDIVVWLKDVEYIKQHWAQHVIWKTINDAE